MSKTFVFKKNTYTLADSTNCFSILDNNTGVGASIPKVDLTGRSIFINPKADEITVIFASAKNNKYPIRKITINGQLLFETNSVKLNKIYRMKRGNFKTVVTGTTSLNILYCADALTDIQSEILHLFESNSDKSHREVLKKLVEDSKDTEKRNHLVLGIGKSEYKIEIPIQFKKTVSILTFDEEEAKTKAKPEKWLIHDVKYIVENYEIQLIKKPWKIEPSDYINVFHRKLKAKNQFSFTREGQAYYPNAIFYCYYNGEYKLELFFLNQKTNKIKLVERDFDLKNFEDLKFLTNNFISDAKK